MATWNHRVIAIREEREDFFQIHEVHYDDDGKVEGWTESAAVACGDDIEEVRMTLHRMLQCLSKPILIVSGNKLIPYEPRNPVIVRRKVRRSVKSRART
jgi:hypothetical protein